MTSTPGWLTRSPFVYLVLLIPLGKYVGSPMAPLADGGHGAPCEIPPGSGADGPAGSLPVAVLSLYVGCWLLTV